MNTTDRTVLLLLGFIIWAAGTAAYRSFGVYFFEGAAFSYWLNVLITGSLYAAGSIGLLRWRGIQQHDWLQAAICIALPGMLGEIPILVNFSHLMSNMQPATAGRYAAFLFGGYSLVISVAFILSTRTSPQASSDPTS